MHRIAFLILGALMCTTSAEAAPPSGASPSGGRALFATDDTTGPEHVATSSLRPSYERCLDASGGVTISVNNCIGSEYDFQDERLNTAYRALRATMTDEQKKALRDDERAWIADRDKSCAPRANGGTADMLDRNACRLDRTADRAAELEAQRNHP